MGSSVAACRLLVLDDGTHADRFYHYADLLSLLCSLLTVQLQLADHVLHIKLCRAEDG